MPCLATAEIDRTAVQNDAIRAHQRVIMDRQMVVCGLSNLCRDLKEIRDMHYYATLGYSDFGQYTEEQHGIGERQAYKYIRIFERLGAEFLNLNSKIGVTKLLELAVLDRDERDGLLSEHNTDELDWIFDNQYEKSVVSSFIIFLLIFCRVMPPDFRL